MAKTYTPEEKRKNFVNYFSYTVGIQVLVFMGCLLVNWLKSNIKALEALSGILFMIFTWGAAIPFCLSFYYDPKNRSGKGLGLFTASIVCLLLSAAGCALGGKLLK